MNSDIATFGIDSLRQPSDPQNLGCSAMTEKFALRYVVEGTGTPKPLHIFVRYDTDGRPVDVGDLKKRLFWRMVARTSPIVTVIFPSQRSVFFVSTSSLPVLLSLD